MESTSAGLTKRINQSLASKRHFKLTFEYLYNLEDLRPIPHGSNVLISEYSKLNTVIPRYKMISG